MPKAAPMSPPTMSAAIAASMFINCVVIVFLVFRFLASCARDRTSRSRSYCPGRLDSADRRFRFLVHLESVVAGHAHFRNVKAFDLVLNRNTVADEFLGNEI